MRTALVISFVLAAAGVVRADSECAAPMSCRKACDTGDATACTWLGEYYTQVPQMIDAGYAPIGVTLLGGACVKDSAGCVALARALRMIASINMVDADDKKITELRAKGCKGGQPEACIGGKVVLALEEKRCKAGRPWDCYAAAIAYAPPGAKRPLMSGDDPPPPDDDESGGSGTAMALAASQKGPKPAPIKKDEAKSKALFARATKLVDDACKANQARTCGGLIDWGDRKHLEIACSIGNSFACTMRGGGAASPRDMFTFQNKACDLGDFLACMAVASMHEEGVATAKSAAKAVEYEQKACDVFAGNACAGLGKRYAEGRDVAKDAAKATELYKKGCDLRSSFACMQRADSLVASDPKQAIGLYQTACEDEDRTGALVRPICSELADRYERGNGVAKDAARAKSLRERGCKQGEKKACTRP